MNYSNSSETEQDEFILTSVSSYLTDYQKDKEDKMPPLSQQHNNVVEVEQREVDIASTHSKSTPPKEEKDRKISIRKTIPVSILGFHIYCKVLDLIIDYYTGFYIFPSINSIYIIPIVGGLVWGIWTIISTLFVIGTIALPILGIISLGKFLGKEPLDQVTLFIIDVVIFLAQSIKNIIVQIIQKSEEIINRLSFWSLVAVSMTITATILQTYVTITLFVNKIVLSLILSLFVILLQHVIRKAVYLWRTMPSK
jgi:uncharacterized membrane protein YwzB